MSFVVVVPMWVVYGATAIIGLVVLTLAVIGGVVLYHTKNFKVNW